MTSCHAAVSGESHTQNSWGWNADRTAHAHIFVYIAGTAYTAYRVTGYRVTGYRVDPGALRTERAGSGGDPKQQPSMEQYHILGRVGEGAHGVVLKAKHLKVRVQLPDLVGSIKSHLCKPRVVMICTFEVYISYVSDQTDWGVGCAEESSSEKA